MEEIDLNILIVDEAQINDWTHFVASLTSSDGAGISTQINSLLESLSSYDVSMYELSEYYRYQTALMSEGEYFMLLDRTYVATRLVELSDRFSSILVKYHNTNVLIEEDKNYILSFVFYKMFAMAFQDTWFLRSSIELDDKTKMALLEFIPSIKEKLISWNGAVYEEFTEMLEDPYSWWSVFNEEEVGLLKEFTYGDGGNRNVMKFFESWFRHLTPTQKVIYF